MQTRTHLIVGKKGSGKTTYAVNLVRHGTRVLVADAGFGEFPFKTVWNFSDLCQEVRRGFFRVCYTPRSWEWPYLLGLARAAGETGGPLDLVLEEASRVPPSKDCPESEELFIMGRHWGVNLYAISTRPRHLPPDFRAGCTHLTAFTTHEPADVAYLSEIIGPDAAGRLPTLPPFKPIEWTDRAGATYGGRRLQVSPSPSFSSVSNPSGEKIVLDNLDKTSENLNVADPPAP